MFDLSPKQRAEVFAMICIVDSFSGGVGKSANLSSRGLGNSFIIGLLVWHVNVLEVVAVLTSSKSLALGNDYASISLLSK